MRPLTQEQIAAAIAAAKAERSKAISALVRELPNSVRRSATRLLERRVLRPKHS
ncbi:MAG: hypothetical protein JO237_02980 [Pseudolabrys sp.]|nr:hypothetical protein [Pseudolabrys sp.]